MNYTPTVESVKAKLERPGSLFAADEVRVLLTELARVGAKDNQCGCEHFTGEYVVCKNCLGRTSLSGVATIRCQQATGCSSATAGRGTRGRTTTPMGCSGRRQT